MGTTLVKEFGTLQDLKSGGGKGHDRPCGDTPNELVKRVGGRALLGGGLYYRGTTDSPEEGDVKGWAQKAPLDLSSVRKSHEKAKNAPAEGNKG